MLAVPQSAVRMSSSSPPSDVLQLEFYNCRPEAPALFSTKFGTRAKRNLIQPYPATIIRTDLPGDVDIRSNQLLEEFAESRDIFEVPHSWFMLHDFFDGYDIWVEGAQFCYYVIHAICRKSYPSTPCPLKDTASCVRLSVDKNNSTFARCETAARF